MAKRCSRAESHSGGDVIAYRQEGAAPPRQDSNGEGRAASKDVSGAAMRFLLSMQPILSDRCIEADQLHLVRWALPVEMNRLLQFRLT